LSALITTTPLLGLESDHPQTGISAVSFSKTSRVWSNRRLRSGRQRSQILFHTDCWNHRQSTPPRRGDYRWATTAIRIGRPRFSRRHCIQSANIPSEM